MTIELTVSEAKTVLHYLQKSLIDAKGYAAIGIGSRESVRNIESVLKKIAKEPQKED